MATPYVTTDLPAQAQPERVKLLPANYSNAVYPVRVAEDRSKIRLEYHLPGQRILRMQCIVATLCIGVVLVPCGVALVLFASFSTLTEQLLGWSGVSIAVFAGTFGPNLVLRARYDQAVRQNPLLEWDRSTCRLTICCGRRTFDTVDVVGLVALTDPHACSDIPNSTQLQLVIRCAGNTYCELVATSVEPAETVFVPALREFAVKTGCRVWVGHAGGWAGWFKFSHSNAIGGVLKL